MTLTYSSMLALGKNIPPSILMDTNNNKYQLGEGSYKAYIFAFICNHCPYVIHIKEKMSELLNNAYRNDFSVFAINSNDMESYPLDNKEMMKNDIKKFNYEFPYLIDEDQSVAKSFQAMCTPEFYIFGNNKDLIYRGRFDKSSPGNNELTDGSDLQMAIQSIKRGERIIKQQYPSMGCNIKWKKGNEPDYVR
ncbi:thioredoxin family protein [Hyphomicrobiales bacterium]|nr:thioredoxin family protein [Hyphomicrobiales bacterium]MDG1152739.1 thioredoxin family protein [Hyphomicrobiales bacterium]|tara:strand:- start:106 stop:681 length:576 start_codon:yes stop_codon:yes gene_type:complete